MIPTLQRQKKIIFYRLTWLCANLYPFTDVIAKPGVTLDEALEMIDIGGPTMIAKLEQNPILGVTVISNPTQYECILKELRENNGETTLETRKN